MPNPAQLADKECVPCRGGVSPLRGGELARLQAELGSGWSVVREHHLEKAFAFADFKTAWAFAGRVAELAEEQGHHPDLHVSWGSVRIEIWTHKIDGLTESDFVLAAKIERVA